MLNLARVAAGFCLLSCPLFAQYTVKRVVFQGTSTYTEQQLQAASAIKPGDQLSAQSLGEKAQALMNTGVFDDLQPSFDGPIHAIDVVFKYKALPENVLLPVSLDNFVWLTPTELQSGLRARVPLYRDHLPQAGTVQAQVRDALQAMLDEKNAKVHVEAIDTPSTDLEPETLHFRVTKPAVYLTGVRLAGLSPANAPALRASLGKVVGAPYNEGIGEAVDDRLLRPFRDTGYLDATITNLQRTPAALPNGTIGVTVSGTVSAGEAYHVSTLRYTPAELFTADEFAKASKLHDGDVASQSALPETPNPILAAYRQRGYVDARVDTHRQMDPQQHMVSYLLAIEPGQPYRVGKLVEEGLQGQAKADYDAHWKMVTGTVYNADYIRAFLRQNSALKSLSPYTAAFEAKADPQTHLVDVTVHFFSNNTGS